MEIRWRTWFEKHNRYLTTFLLTSAFILSLISDVDCFFVIVDVGFEPMNSHYNSTTFGIGLWTVEDPEKRGICAMPMFSDELNGMTHSDNSYSSLWINGDVSLFVSRIISSCGVAVGFASMVFVWVCLCMNSSQQIMIELSTTTIFVALALGLEGTKLGLIFETKPCTSEDFWERIDQDEVSTFHKADACLFARGTYMSLFAIVTYGIVIIYLMTVAMLSDHQNSGGYRQGVPHSFEYDYDNVTLPSYLGSICSSKRSLGSSIVSKNSSIISKYSKESSKDSGSGLNYNSGQNSKVSSGSDGSGGMTKVSGDSSGSAEEARQLSAFSTPADSRFYSSSTGSSKGRIKSDTVIAQLMEPIVEGDDSDDDSEWKWTSENTVMNDTVMAQRSNIFCDRTIAETEV
mmetsp:Transcript_13975/g.16984  ORF Transcript_13975/g.16984 Transcript_13975/m.16984 type:complete len:402 (+) Transcript_13975:171-1376(+)